MVAHLFKIKWPSFMFVLNHLKGKIIDIDSVRYTEFQYMLYYCTTNLTRLLTSMNGYLNLLTKQQTNILWNGRADKVQFTQQ